MGIFTVCGMHRSGTSLLCKILNESGIVFPGELLVASDNPNGHFENQSILAFHKQCLKIRDYDASGLDVNTIELNLSASEKNEYDKVFSHEIPQDRKFYAWKDPRSILFRNSWPDRIKKGFFICIYRRYNEVADSLFQRYWKARFIPTSNKLRLFKRQIEKIIVERSIYPNFVNQWYLYNEALLSLLSTTDNYLLISADQLKKDPSIIIGILNEKLNIDLRSVLKEQVVRNDLMKQPKTSDLPKWKINHRAEDLYRRLNKKENLYRT